MTVLSVVALAGWYIFLQSKIRGIQNDHTGSALGGDVSFGPTQRTKELVSSSSGAQSVRDVSPHVVASSTLPRAWHIAAEPVAGDGFVAMGTSSTRVRFVERATGNVFDAFLDTNTVVRVTNTLVPSVYDAIISSDGRVIERNADGASMGTVQITSAEIAPLIVKPLAKTVQSVAFSASGKEIVALLPSQGKLVGVRSGVDGSKPMQIFSSNIVGWNVRWLADGRIIVAQNPADGVAGYAYEVQKNNVLVPLARGNGLAVLPRASSTSMVYSTFDEQPTLFVRVNGTTTPVSLKTIADKCVWSPTDQFVVFCAAPPIMNHGFLDMWYRGEVHLADQWWKIDVRTGVVETLFVPDTPVDVQDPSIDVRGKYLIFKNAIDQSLWSLRIDA